MQKWMILKLIPYFIFVYLHKFENYGSWTVYKRVKGNKSAVWLYFIPKNEITFVYIVKYTYISF